MTLIFLTRAWLGARAFWLHGEGDPEQIEGALLEGGRRRDFVELDRRVGLQAHAVLHDRPQMTQERLEAVDGLPRLRPLRQRLGLCPGRPRGRHHHRAAPGRGGRRVVVSEEQGG